MDGDPLLYIGAGSGALAYAYTRFDFYEKKRFWPARMAGLGAFAIGVWLEFKGVAMAFGWTL